MDLEILSDAERKGVNVANAVDSDLMVQARRSLYSAVVADACDAIGLRHQCVQAGLLHSITSNSVAVGWARTVLVVPVDTIASESYAEEIQFMDSLTPGEVVVASCEGVRAAAWGELFSAAAIARGAVGAIIDGFTRDVARIPHTGLPVFARGTQPNDSLARCSYHLVGEPILLGEVVVHTGDLVVADQDGVVVVPSAHATEVLRRALEKANRENQARAMLADGALLRTVWNEIQVL